MSPNDFRQRFDDVLNTLRRGNQAEGEQHPAALHSKFVFVVVGVDEGRVVNAVRYEGNLIARNIVCVFEEAVSTLVHHDELL